MALKQHDSIGSNETSKFVDAGQVLVVSSLLLAVAVTLGLRGLVSLDALAPAVATLLFGLAAVACGFGLLLRRYAPRAGFIDVAGVLTFVGIVVSITIEPDQMVRLMALSEPD